MRTLLVAGSILALAVPAFADGPATSLSPVGGKAVTAGAQRSMPDTLLYDNGGPDLVNGYSILSHVVGDRRSVLDDLELPAGGGTPDFWSTQMLWDTLFGTGHATQVELTFYGDDNGNPDFANQLGQMVSTDITETLEGSQFFGRDVIIMTANFAGLWLPDGRIWIDQFYVGPENSFIQTAAINFSPCWVDYGAFGGRQPGFNIFNVDSDVMFRLEGSAGGGGMSGTLDCPIGGGKATLSLSGGTPGGKVGVVASTNGSGFTIPVGPCAGTIIATRPAFLAGFPITLTFNANGDLSVSKNVPAGLCGVISVSAVDLTTCDVVDLP